MNVYDDFSGEEWEVVPLLDALAAYVSFTTTFWGVDPYRVKLTCRKCCATFEVADPDFCRGNFAETTWRQNHVCGAFVLPAS